MHCLIFLLSTHADIPVVTAMTGGALVDKVALQQPLGLPWLLLLFLLLLLLLQPARSA